MRPIACALLLLAAVAAAAVEPPTLAEYRERRERLADALDGPVILFAADHVDLVEYKQEDNFRYLTGFEGPGAVLLIDGSGEAYVETLYLPQRNLDEERWSGVRLGPGAGAAETTGVETVADLAGLRERLRTVARRAGAVYALSASTADSERVRDLAPDVRLRDAAPAIARMRQVKSASELSLLERAAEITKEAHAAAARTIAPGVWEYEVEAAIEYEFRRSGATGPGFPSIVGSGPNSTVLHYNSNQRGIEAGELVVVDIGAEYAGYSADITRTYPVGGRFTDRQKEIYQIVLDAQAAALARVRPGARFAGIHQAAREHIESKGYGRYFIHGTSHHVGLHVHDVGDTGRALEPNMVLTVEPGIYIPEENLGVRIEDEVVVTETGYRLLSDFPKDPAAIEALMARRR